MADEGEDVVQELIALLAVENPEVRKQAVKYLLQYSGTEEQRKQARDKGLFPQLMRFLGSRSEMEADAIATLINYSQDEWGCREMLSVGIIDSICVLLKDLKYPVVEYAALLLCNITQQEDACRYFLQRNGMPLQILVDALIGRDQDVAADALSFVIMNITRERGVAAYMYRRSQAYFPRLSKVLHHAHPSRRVGISSAFRNICVLEGSHRELVDTDVVAELALILLVPLERLTAKEFQHLPAEWIERARDLKPEANAKVRKQVIEALTLLSSSEAGRGFLQPILTYELLSTLHDAETENTFQEALVTFSGTLHSERVASDVARMVEEGLFITEDRGDQDLPSMAVAMDIQATTAEEQILEDEAADMGDLF